MVKMELSRILIRELEDLQLIELREVLQRAPSEDDPARQPRSFPIVIGLPEAQAIERRLKGIEVKRPQTHDLLANVIERLGATLEAIELYDLSEHTFYARLVLRAADGSRVDVDSRPSDAIALGIARGAAILVAEHVLDSAMRDPDDEATL
ncbi:MAG: bifunctional nuclease family protein [Phycisphaerales bacterium]|jgi:bifunctional DNase/RNase|nr:bifunctional nuclease family protein [Phycisphaerales bacterium]